MPKTKKGTKKGSAKKGGDKSPQILAAKGGLTSAGLLEEVMRTMDEENWITKKQGRDFVDSLHAVIADQLSEGSPVNLFGVVKIVPRLHTAGERMVNKEFGNPDSGKVKKTYKAKVSLKTGQGIFAKKTVKDHLPSPAKLAKVVG